MSDLQKLVGMSIVKIDEPEPYRSTKIFHLVDKTGQPHTLTFESHEGADVFLDSINYLGDVG